MAQRQEITRVVVGEVVCIAVGEKNSPTDQVHSLMIGRELTNYLLGDVEE
jgi:hypothetical protein